MRRGQRLTRRSDFEHVRTNGVRASDRHFILGAARNEIETTRFGLAVSRRVGGAVVRNRVKRRIRAALDSMPFAEGWNVVVSARPAAAEATYREISESLKRLGARLGVLAYDSVDHR